MNTGKHNGKGVAGAVLLCLLFGAGCRQGSSSGTGRAEDWIGVSGRVESAADYNAVEWRTNAPPWAHIEVGRLSFVTSRGPRYVTKRILRAASKVGADAVVLRSLERAGDGAEGGWAERESALVNGHLHAAFSHAELAPSEPAQGEARVKRGERWRVAVVFIRRTAIEPQSPPGQTSLRGRRMAQVP